MTTLLPSVFVQSFQLAQSSVAERVYLHTWLTAEVSKCIRSEVSAGSVFCGRKGIPAYLAHQRNF